MSTTETQAVPAGTWALDPVHSTVGFAVSYMAGRFTGAFGDFDAVVTDGVLTGSAKVASVQVKDPNLAAHLQSPEFFDAERYPELAFESSAIERTGNRIRIDGEITIKGHTEPVGESATCGSGGPTVVVRANAAAAHDSPASSEFGGLQLRAVEPGAEFAFIDQAA